MPRDRVDQTNDAESLAAKRKLLREIRADIMATEIPPRLAVLPQFVCPGRYLGRCRRTKTERGYLMNHQMTVHLGAPPANKFLGATTGLLKRLKPRSDRSHRTRTSLPRLSCGPRTAHRQSCIDDSLKAWAAVAAPSVVLLAHGQHVRKRKTPTSRFSLRRAASVCIPHVGQI
jgi:hypothetical protein